jgi:two-component system alkaline phosphatase synthesis response regulator PhoP
MPDIRVLVIDDEQNILDVVSAYLHKEGYTVFTATDGPAGLKAAQTRQPDIVILDVMLPGMDGIELLVELRRASNVYVILLSARSEETDKIVGLSVGADDYLTKPFSPRELVARVKAGLRRLGASAGGDRSDSLVFRHIRIEPASRKAWKDDVLLDLTGVEFDLLLALAQHAGRVLSRDQLLQRIWGHDFYGEERVVDVHIGHIRKKLGDDPNSPQYIVTVRGVGYRFEDGGIGG